MPKEEGDSDLFRVVEMLVGCLTKSQDVQAERMEALIGRLLEEQRIQLTTISSSFSTTNHQVVESVTLLAETILLGRDSPTTSENSPMNSVDDEPSGPTSADWSALPESARMAQEEEDRLTTMLGPSSSPPGDLGLT